MKVKYIGAPNDGLPDDHETTAFGHSFTRGKVTEIDNDHPALADITSRVKGNPHFEIVGGAPKKAEPEPIQKVALVPDPDRP